jgi:hypothetical protein
MNDLDKEYGPDVSAMPVNGITPNHVRLHQWTSKQAWKLDRQHHPFGKHTIQELDAISDAIGATSGKLQAATGQSHAMVNGDGILIADMQTAGIRLNGKRVVAFDLFASGPGRYDVRVIGKPLKDDSAELTDDKWLAGAELLAEARDVPMAWLLKTLERLLGVSLTEPMPADRVLRAVLDRAEDSFTKCDCEECAAATKAAEANGTEVADEKRKIATAKGDHDFDDVWARIDDLRLLAAGGSKVADATKRSTIVTPDPYKQLVN